MPLTRDESRALAFVALLLLLAVAARAARREPPVDWAAHPVDLDSLERAAGDRLDDRERRARPLAPGERIDPNVASEDQLDRLPGVGPALARRIVAVREADGPFRSLEDLTRVPGVGRRSVRKLEPYLWLPPASPGAGPVGAAGAGDVGAARAARTPDAARTGLTARTPAGAAEAGAPALDLNRATAVELETLPGIGPALAARIVAYRDSVGGFGAVDELVRVRGIGPVTLERLRPRLRVRP